MSRVPVLSSNVVSVGYEGTTMTIEFRSGFIYAYEDVEPELHTAFMEAESKGKFFSLRIRGKYEYAKLVAGQP